MKQLRVIDSHTGGEPTRVLVAGGPQLDSVPGLEAEKVESVTGLDDVLQAVSPLSVNARREIFRQHFDRYRRAIVLEPRGSEVMVGAMLVPPQNRQNLAGVIFFNNTGYLGMCGHGMLGVVETLRYLGSLKTSTVTLETAVGVVKAEIDSSFRVTLENVPSYREVAGIGLSIEGLPDLQAEIAYGGNWFCLIEAPDAAWLDQSSDILLGISKRILTAVQQRYPKVDHVELFGPAKNPAHHSRSFVLCPGGAFDRSPCGTGTSAKLACLAADGKLKPEETWFQESYIGSMFEASYRWKEGTGGPIVPRITSRAFLTGDCTLLVDVDDPFGWGLPEIHPSGNDGQSR